MHSIKHKRIGSTGRIGILLTGTLLLVGCDQRRSKPSESDPASQTQAAEAPAPPKADSGNFETIAAYEELRTKVLELKPEKKGPGEPDQQQVLALLMETGYNENVATLIVGHGMASVHFSNGNGNIDASHIAPVRSHSRSLVRLAEKYLSEASRTDQHPMPKESGDVCFYLVTGGGVHGAAGKEADFRTKSHPLSPLYHKAHELLAAIGEPSDL